MATRKLVSVSNLGPSPRRAAGRLGLRWPRKESRGMRGVGHYSILMGEENALFMGGEKWREQVVQY